MATLPSALQDQGLSTATQELFSSLNFLGGDVTTQSVTGAGLIVSGQGGNQTGTGLPENQTLFVNQGTDAPVTAAIEDGVLAVTVTLPPGVDLAVSGPAAAVNANQMTAYINDLVGKALSEQASDPYVAAYIAALEKAINTLQQQVDGQEVVVRVVSFAGSSGSASGSATTETASTGNNIVFDAGSAATNELFALRLDQVADGTTVTLKNVENAMLIDSGSVIVDGSTAARVVGDMTDQKITGGAGNDTLVGGGGNDTLVGGAGDDVLGFNALGHYTLEGFGNGSDKLAFDIDTITNIAQLEALITDVQQADGNVTYVFNQGEASITLIGVTADQISADLVQFTL